MSHFYWLSLDHMTQLHRLDEVDSKFWVFWGMIISETDQLQELVRSAAAAFIRLLIRVKTFLC